MRSVLLPITAAVVLACSPAVRAQGQVTYETEADGSVRVHIAGRKVARYAPTDPRIRRPFLCDVKTLSGIQVTRHHPPVEGKDATDHDTMHPGIWMSFGDLNGKDYWRGREGVRVVSAKVISPSPWVEFRNEYLASDGKDVVAREECRLEFEGRPSAWLLRWRSTFRPGKAELVFGDQEEMGFGVRVATPLTVKAGGTIRDSEGRVNEKGVWGKTADWCEYRGTVDGKQVGLFVMPDPDNFRPSWFHARDYGLLVANPFGRNAFTGGEKSREIVRPGESLTLSFVVCVFETGPGETFDPASFYKDLRARMKPR